MSKQGLYKLTGFVSGVVPGVVSGVVPGIVHGGVSGVVPSVLTYLESQKRCQRIASSGCYKNSASDNLNSRNTRLFETDQINFNSSTLIGSNDGTNLSLIWLINAPIHSFIQVEILEPWIGCGSSLGQFHFRWLDIQIGI